MWYILEEKKYVLLTEQQTAVGFTVYVCCKDNAMGLYLSFLDEHYQQL